MGKESVSATDMQRSIAERYARDVVGHEAEMAAAAAATPEEAAEHFQKEKNQRRGQFKAVLAQVVAASDVLVQVLDARDPESTRNAELEA